MAVTSGTVQTYDRKGLREKLAEAIYSISPEETPFSSSVSRGSTSATLTEWQTDELAAAVSTNAQIEGDEYSYTTPAATVRVGNHSQIMTKTARVAKTAEAVDKAGRASEMAYQVMKRGKELRRDLEKNLCENIGGTGGGAGTARKFATLGAWFKTNVSYYTTDGGNPVYTSGVPGAARTDGGTLRAFTETIGKAVMSLAWTAGGHPTTLMVGPFNKQAASAFAGIADRVFNLNAPAKPTAVVSAVDVWATDFGTLRIVPNRFQRERDAYFHDFDQYEVLFLRPMQTEDLANTGDARQKALVQEVTLKVKQEAGCGAAFDLTTA